MNEKKNLKKTVDKLTFGLRKVDYHKRQYMNYDRIVKTTKGRKGLFKIIYNIAVRRCAYHWTKAFDLAWSGFVKCSDLLKELEK